MASALSEKLVVDASALLEALIGTQLGDRVRSRMRGSALVAPAHLDAEILSALGRLHRADEISDAVVSSALQELAAAPIQRHPLPGLLHGAWERRANLRLVDALYVELAATLEDAVLITTDARLCRAEEQAELIATEG